MRSHPGVDQSGWLLFLVFTAAAQPALSTPRPAAAVQARLSALSGKLPLSFEANQGQTDKSIQYLSRAPGYTLFLTPGEAVLALNGKRGATKPSTVRLRLVGANPNPAASALEIQSTRTNYFIGNDPKKWRTNIPNYERVKYAAVYPGIDMVYYGNGRALEHDFVVAAGSDPSQIALSLSGSKPAIDRATGDLLLPTEAGQLRLNRPVTYQEINGKRREVASSYRRSGAHEVGFQIGAYDHTAALVIDPVLVYSTYLGDSKGGDYASAIAVDAFGNAYVGGQTGSADFPTKDPFQGTLKGDENSYISKFTPEGTLAYSTYLGGGGADLSRGIALDASGNIYVTGSTNSTDFPTRNPLQAHLKGIENAFVTEIAAGGQSLVYSTYIGGSIYDEANSIAVDTAGNTYVAGLAGSCDFPTFHAFQSVNRGCATDGWNAFVFEINATGSAFVYSTYLGGSVSDEGAGIVVLDQADGIAVDTEGNAYVTGTTGSVDFPLLNPIQSTLSQSEEFNVFVTAIQAGGGALVYSTFLFDSVLAGGIAVDGLGNAYVCGSTVTTGLPINPYLGPPKSEGAAFLAEIKPRGAGLVFYTYFGGSEGSEVGWAIALDQSGNIYVTGETTSRDLPLLNAFENENLANPPPADVYGVIGFVAEFGPAGSSLIYSSYLGGNSVTSPVAVAVDRSGNAYVTGYTLSEDFPLVNAFQTTFAEPFVSKISPGIDEARAPAPVFSPPGGTYSSTQAVSLSDGTTGAEIYYTLTYGSTPTTRSTRYSGPFMVERAGSVAAIATVPGKATSAVASAYYGFRVDEPFFSSVALGYDESETVTLSDARPDVAIHYTLDGTTPTASSTLYSRPILVKTPLTIAAIATLAGYENSTAAVSSYKPPAAAPVVSPATGVYTAPPTVTLEDRTPGAKIYYTTDYGATPSTSSTLYTGPFTTRNTGTIAAIAVASGYSNSPVGRSFYGLRVNTPVIHPEAGDPSGPITLTISDATPGAVIYYYVDGADWWAQYSGPVTLPRAGNIYAYAVLSGYEDSSFSQARL